MSLPVSGGNRLVREKSPYLLQHAQNPVDWYPWSEEAFAKAREEDKPVFLSIGYSTCHWCHVMARESFMDQEIASILNRDFVPVKVDREERPDVDHVYMSVCQRLTGSGGWPLTVIMTPDKKPFFAGTYFPKESRFGLMGLRDILATIAKAWSEDREVLTAQAERVYESLKDDMTAGPSPESGLAGLDDVVERAYRHLSESFDDEHGGFGTAPKFLTPHTLTFLLRYWKRSGKKRALQMAEKTMLGAHAGGVYDHVGFGFFRYSTDSKWLIPHFEKMLYDQATALIALTELWLCTKKDLYREIAYEIAHFLETEMKSPEGAFWSAIDAESEGEEGKSYVWTPDEVVSVLGQKEGEAFCREYGITPEGNFHGKSVPNLIRHGQKPGDAGEPAAGRARNRAKLYEARARRPRPGIDDKVLTSWNALIVAALAKAGRTFRDESFIDSAASCLAFIEGNLQRDGTLYARYREGDVAFRGYLDDYAFLIWAYLEMREATLDESYLEKAVALARSMVKSFWDQDSSAFYVTADDAEELILRPRESWDGAIPSGNSVAVMDLLRISRLTDDQEMQEIALSVMGRLSGALRREPTGLLHLLSAAMYAAGDGFEIQVVGRPDDPRLQAMFSYLRDVYLPDAQVVLADPSAAPSQESPGNPDGDEDGSFLVICRAMTCSAPLRSVEELQRALVTTPAQMP
ncbi:MAG: thioredoxin domain-containing protein [Bacillota bacterium]